MMSTSYYRLRPPVTHLRLESGGGHDRLSIWIDHGLAGVLRLPKAATRDLLRAFILDEVDSECPLLTHWGGKAAVVTVNDGSLPDETVVVSEYGELLTVAEVKVRDGAVRSDGMPTELFGYEGVQDEAR
jgi:hypothetical protein